MYPTIHHQELQPKEILKVFKEKYVNICDPIELKEVHFIQKDGGISTEIILKKYGVPKYTTEKEMVVWMP